MPINENAKYIDTVNVTIELTQKKIRGKDKGNDKILISGKLGDIRKLIADSDTLRDRVGDIMDISASISPWP